MEHPQAGRLAVPGPPYRLSATPWRSRPAEALGASNQRALECLAASSVPSPTPPPARRGGDRPGPLAHIRVADLSWIWALPYATHLMALLGAQVIRVESRRRADLTRLNGPYPGGAAEGGLDESLYYNGLNPSKWSLGVDLATPEGLEVVKQLVAVSDVVASNFRPGVLERLGLGYDTLRAINPRIILVKSSVYGEGGPHSGYGGYAAISMALAGATDVTGYRGGPPSLPGWTTADSVAAVHAGVALLAALRHRDRTGAGQLIELAQAETMAATMGIAVLEAQRGVAVTRRGNESDRLVPNGCYRCQDAGTGEQWVSLCVGSDEEWRALCAVMGRPDLGQDPRFASLAGRRAARDTIDAAIARWTAEQAVAVVVPALQAWGVAAAPVLTLADLLSDEQLASREFFHIVDHPASGPQPVAAYPMGLAGYRPEVRPAPRLGEHTDRVLRELLGYDPDTIAALRQRGAVE